MRQRNLLTKIRACLALVMVHASIGAPVWAQVEIIGGMHAPVGSAAATAAGLSVTNIRLAPALTPAGGALSAASSLVPAPALAAPSAAAAADKPAGVPTPAAAAVPASANAAQAPAQAEGAKVSAIGANLAEHLKTAADGNSSAGGAQAAGRGIINAVAGGRDAEAEGDVAPSPAAGLPAARPQNVLDKMGLREKILKGGGIEFGADGKMKPVAEPIHMQAFDNDDNIAYYRTHIYLQNKTTHAEASLPTSEFAEVRTTIGKSGKYADFEYFKSDEGGSFRDFRDMKDADVFVKDAADAIDSTHAGMFRGPAWLAWAQGMKNPATAPWAAVITSRGHEPKNMVRGFDVFKDRGFTKRSPREEMIFPVSNAALSKALTETSTPEQKTEVIIALIDLLDSIPLVKPGDRHYFAFSDDDLDMITRVKNKLAQEQVIGRRWPHVKIALFSTGPGTESRTELTAGLQKSLPEDAAPVVKPAPVPAPAVVAAAPVVAPAAEPIPQAGTAYPGDAAVKTRKITDTIFVVYDIETTGLHPEVNAPVQIGAVKFRVKKDGSIENLGTFDELVDPKAPMPADVTVFTNITNGDLQGKPSIEQVLPKFRAFIGEDAVLMGHNVAFDTGFLGYQMKEHGIAAMPQMVIDTREMVKNLFPDILDRRLAELMAVWQLGNVEDHNGLADSENTAKVFARALQRVAELKKSSVADLTVGDAAEKSPNFHFDSILDTLSGLPVEHPRKPGADIVHEVEVKALELFWKRQPSQLRDVAAALGMDYAAVRDALREHAKKASVSPADGILSGLAGDPPDALIFSYDSLVDRNSRQETYPVIAGDVVEGLVRVLQSGRPVGVVASYGLEDEAALRAKIPAKLNDRLFFSRAGARPLYEAMKAGGVDVPAKNWLIVGTHLSVAEAFPEADVVSVGDPAISAFSNARHLGIKGSRASLRIADAVTSKNVPPSKSAKISAAEAAAAVPAKAEEEGRRVAFLFNWDDVIRSHPKTPLEQFAAQPKSVWQGSSWFDFANAVSNAELAGNVHIVGRSPAAIAADLKTLHELGLIKSLPATANLRPAVSGPSKDLAALKASLDLLQAAPSRNNSNKITNQNGTAKKLLHLYAVADGNWDSYVATRKALAADIRKNPKRWSRVKIVLRYTGADAADKKDAAVALTTEGKSRALLINEFAEPFAGRFSEKKAPGVREKVLPIETSIHSTMPSVDAAIKTMYVSHAYGNADPRVVEADDLVARERKAVADFVVDTKIPNARKHIILTRYHVEDKLLAQVLVGALKAGIRVDFITDFNSSMEYAFADKSQQTLEDFSKAKPTQDALGEFLQILLDGGFKIVGNGSKATPLGSIYSQPIFNKKASQYNKMIPIMHEKSLLFVVDSKDGMKGASDVTDYFFGTANLSDHKRYNRLFELQDEATESYALEHAVKLMGGFRAGQLSIEPERPHRVWYEDGSFMEMAYTNGRYNLNGRIVDLFERASKGELQIENVVFSHFAPTKTNLFPALRKAMLAQSGFRIFSISDEKFTNVASYGKVAVMGGFLVTPPLGGPGWGWSGDLAKRAKVLEFLKGVEGKVESDPDGAPYEREVWHDKTTIVYVNEEGRRWAYIFTGSFNASNKADNLELQFLFRMPVTSAWPKAVEDSIIKTVEAQKDFVLPINIGLVRDSIAAAVGMSPLYVPLKAAEALVKAAATRDTSEFEAQWQAMVAEANRILHLEGAASEAFMRRATMRLKTLLGFMAWFHSEREQGRMNYPLTVQKIVAMATVVGKATSVDKNSAMSKYSVKTQLNKVMWDPTADKDELERRISSAWDVLGIVAPMPRRADKWGGTQKDPRRIKEPKAPFVPVIPKGNHLTYRDQGAFDNALNGVSSVFLRGGVNKGHKVGAGQLDLEGSQKSLQVTFDAVEEMPYAKVTAAILNGLAPGLTKKEMLKTMQSYYPGFTSSSMVTVIRFHPGISAPERKAKGRKAAAKPRKNGGARNTEI
ncbi:MAG: PolC-type DNA polymerase III [Elusimicrobiota bacterium]